MDRTEQEIQRGEHARRLMEDELLCESLEKIKTEYTEQWKNSPVRDVEGREKLFLMVKTVEKFQSELETVLNTGKLAKATLAQKIGARLRGG